MWNYNMHGDREIPHQQYRVGAGMLKCPHKAPKESAFAFGETRPAQFEDPIFLSQGCQKAKQGFHWIAMHERGQSVFSIGDWPCCCPGGSSLECGQILSKFPRIVDFIFIGQLLTQSGVPPSVMKLITPFWNSRRKNTLYVCGVLVFVPPRQNLEYTSCELRRR